MASWLAPLREATHILLDLLYPPRCAGCGRFGAWYCPACQAQTVSLPITRCPICGGPGGEAGDPCRRCQYPAGALNGVLASTLFVPPVRPAIHRFKYDAVRVLAVPFAERLAGTWLATGLVADLIVPVPLHPSREAERGYNQAALLADALSSTTGVVVAHDLLVRRRATASQTAMNHDERRENVRDAFFCCRPAGGQRVLLVDDVFTTGATMEACAQALLAAGAASVWGLAVARAA